MKTKLLTLTALAQLAFILPQSASAQTPIDWSATAGNTTWSAGANWVGGSAPASDLTTNTAQFNQTSYTAQPNYGTTSIAGIIVGDGSTATAALTLSGGNLSIGASGIDIKAAAGNVTVSNAVKLGGNQTWSNNSSNLLTVGATVTNISTASPFILTIDGTGDTKMTAAIAGAGGNGTTGLKKNGAGTLTLSGANTFTGGLIINAGTVKFTGTNSLGGGTVTIGGSGNTVIDNSGINQTLAGVTGWTLTGAGTITRANSGTTGTGGGIGWGTAKITGSSGGLIYTAGSASSVIQVGAVTSDYTGGTTLTSGQILINGTLNGDTLTAGSFGNASDSSNIVKFNGASIRCGTTGGRTIFNNIDFFVDTTHLTGSGTTGNLTFAGNVTLNGSGTTRTLNQQSSTMALVFSGAIKDGTATNFTTNITGNKSLILSGTNTYTGNTTVTGGTMVLSGTGSVNTSALVSVSTGATLTNNSTVDLTAPLSLTEGTAVNGSGNFATTNLAVSGDLTGGAFTPINVSSAGFAKPSSLAFTLSNPANLSSVSIFSGSTTISGVFTSVSVGGSALSDAVTPGTFTADIGGFTYTFTDGTNTLSVAAIPEPKTWALIGMGIGFTLFRFSARDRRLNRNSGRID